MPRTDKDKMASAQAEYWKESMDKGYLKRLITRLC